MVKKVSEEKSSLHVTRGSLSRDKTKPAEKTGNSGILVQDLGQLQRTCQELERELAQRTAELREAEAKLHRLSPPPHPDLQKSNDLLDAICKAHSQFLSDECPGPLFDELHRRILSLTQSEFGFIGEVFHTPEGKPYLRTHAITNIAWDHSAQKFVDEHAATGLEFHNLDNLFGRVITGGKPVISNDPGNDPRAGGTPEGHPPLKSFLGLPFYHHDRLIGMVGLANRKEGYDQALIDFLQPFLKTCSSLIISYQNHSSRLKAENHLASYHDRLVHSEKLSALGKLSASIAHELNNPIYGIRNVLEKIQESPMLSAKHKDFVNLAIKECNRVKNLLENLQSFHKPSPGKKEPVDLHKILDEILLLTQKRLSQMKVKIIKHYALGLPQVPAVTDQIKQVILNLLQNAEEAMTAKGGEIIISTKERDDQVQLRIRDTGVGIHPEQMKKLLDPFFTTKSSIKGTGLGLSISCNIIHAHGGKITVTSGPGKGSEFTVSLPLKGT